MMTQISRSLLLLLLSGLAATSHGCRVRNAEGKDVTARFFDLATEGVICPDERSCEGFQISDCARVHCAGVESCSGANITNVSESLICDAKHACHYTNVTGPSEKSLGTKEVVCTGDGGCDVANIYMPHATAYCLGGRACRKTKITAKTVLCHLGTSSNDACSNYSGITAQCMVCGTNGCDSHINFCRFRTWTTMEELEALGDGDRDGYSTCSPDESAGGNCPSNVWQRFGARLNSRAEDEESGSRLLRGVV